MSLPDEELQDLGLQILSKKKYDYKEEKLKNRFLLLRNEMDMLESSKLPVQDSLITVSPRPITPPQRNKPFLFLNLTKLSAPIYPQNASNSVPSPVFTKQTKKINSLVTFQNVEECHFEAIVNFNIYKNSDVGAEHFKLLEYDFYNLKHEKLKLSYNNNDKGVNMNLLDNDDDDDGHDGHGPSQSSSRWLSPRPHDSNQQHHTSNTSSLPSPNEILSQINRHLNLTEKRTKPKLKLPMVLSNQVMIEIEYLFHIFGYEYQDEMVIDNIDLDLLYNAIEHDLPSDDGKKLNLHSIDEDMKGFITQENLIHTLLSIDKYCLMNSILNPSRSILNDVHDHYLLIYRRLIRYTFDIIKYSLLYDEKILSYEKQSRSKKIRRTSIKELYFNHDEMNHISLPSDYNSTLKSLLKTSSGTPHPTSFHNSFHSNSIISNNLLRSSTSIVPNPSLLSDKPASGNSSPASDRSLENSNPSTNKTLKSPKLKLKNKSKTFLTKNLSHHESLNSINSFKNESMNILTLIYKLQQLRSQYNTMEIELLKRIEGNEMEQLICDQIEHTIEGKLALRYEIGFINELEFITNCCMIFAWHMKSNPSSHMSRFHLPSILSARSNYDESRNNSHFSSSSSQFHPEQQQQSSVPSSRWISWTIYFQQLWSSSVIPSHQNESEAYSSIASLSSSISRLKRDEILLVKYQSLLLLLYGFDTNCSGFIEQNEFQMIGKSLLFPKNILDSLHFECFLSQSSCHNISKCVTDFVSYIIKYVHFYSYQDFKRFKMKNTGRIELEKRSKIAEYLLICQGRHHALRLLADYEQLQLKSSVHDDIHIDDDDDDRDEDDRKISSRNGLGLDHTDHHIDNDSHHSSYNSSPLKSHQRKFSPTKAKLRASHLFATINIGDENETNNEHSMVQFQSLLQLQYMRSLSSSVMAQLNSLYYRCQYYGMCQFHFFHQDRNGKLQNEYIETYYLQSLWDYCHCERDLISVHYDPHTAAVRMSEKRSNKTNIIQLNEIENQFFKSFLKFIFCTLAVYQTPYVLKTLSKSKTAAPAPSSLPHSGIPSHKGMNDQINSKDDIYESFGLMINTDLIYIFHLLCSELNFHFNRNVDNYSQIIFPHSDMEKIIFKTSKTETNSTIWNHIEFITLQQFISLCEEILDINHSFKMLMKYIFKHKALSLSTNCCCDLSLWNKKQANEELLKSLYLPSSLLQLLSLYHMKARVRKICILSSGWKMKILNETIFSCMKKIISFDENILQVIYHDHDMNPLKRLNAASFQMNDMMEYDNILYYMGYNLSMDYLLKVHVNDFNDKVREILSFPQELFYDTYQTIHRELIVSFFSAYGYHLKEIIQTIIYYIQNHHDMPKISSNEVHDNNIQYDRISIILIDLLPSLVKINELIYSIDIVTNHSKPFHNRHFSKSLFTDFLKRHFIFEYQEKELRKMIQNYYDEIIEGISRSLLFLDN
jgi:hypothetical protein